MKRCDYCGGDAGLDVVSAPDQIGVLHYSKIDCAAFLKLQVREEQDRCKGYLEMVQQKNEQLEKEFDKNDVLNRQVGELRKVVEWVYEQRLDFIECAHGEEIQRRCKDALSGSSEKRKCECLVVGAHRVDCPEYKRIDGVVVICECAGERHECKDLLGRVR